MDIFLSILNLASFVFERSNHKKKMEYTKRIAELRIAYRMERQKPTHEQWDGKIERLMIEIQELAKVAEHEARIINNDSINGK